MKIINATPPKDFPSQVIMMDSKFAQRHPSKAFYLRVSKDNGDVDVIDLDDILTVPQARKMAEAKGYAPSHWMDVAIGVPSSF